jgi:hypothetical protein
VRGGGGASPSPILGPGNEWPLFAEYAISCNENSLTTYNKKLNSYTHPLFPKSTDFVRSSFNATNKIIVGARCIPFLISEFLFKSGRILSHENYMRNPLLDT